MKSKSIIAVIFVVFLLSLMLTAAGGSAVAVLCTWQGDESTNWSTAGNWDCNLVPDNTLDVLIPASAPLFPVLSEDSAANNMEVEFGASLDGAGWLLDVVGTLTNNGTLSNTLNLSSAGKDYFNTGGYGGVTLEKNTGPGITPAGQTTVIINGNQACDTVDSTVRRCFDIQPLGLGLGSTTSINAIFYFSPSELNGLTCNTLQAYHWNGSQWLMAGSTVERDCETTTTPNYSVTVNNITSFSPFVLSVGVPTAVSLVVVNVSMANGQLLIFAVVGFAALALMAGLVFAVRKRPRT